MVEEEEAFQGEVKTQKDVCVCVQGFCWLFDSKRHIQTLWSPQFHQPRPKILGFLNVFPSSSQFCSYRVLSQGVLNMFPKFPMCLYQHVLNNSASLCPIHTLFWLCPLGTSLGGPIFEISMFLLFWSKYFLYWVGTI